MRPLFRAVWMVTRPKVPSRPEHKTAAFRQFKPRKRADFVSLPVSVSHELRVENVDQVVAKAAKLGAKQQGPVSDMFWGESLWPARGSRGVYLVRSYAHRRANPCADEEADD
jgi:hypothetical protein